MHSHPRTNSPQTRPTNASIGSAYSYGISNPNISGQRPSTFNRMIPPTNNSDNGQVRPRNFSAGQPVLMTPSTNASDQISISGNIPYYQPPYQGSVPSYPYSSYVHPSYGFSHRGRGDTHFALNHAAIGQSNPPLRFQTGSRRTHDPGWASNYGMSSPSMNSQNTMMHRQAQFDSLRSMYPAPMQRQVPSQNIHPSYATPEMYHQPPLAFYDSNAFQNYPTTHPGYHTSSPSPHPGYSTKPPECSSSQVNPPSHGGTLYATQNYVPSPYPVSVSQLSLASLSVEPGHGHAVAAPGNRTLGFAGPPPRPSLNRSVDPEVVDLDADENDTTGDQTETLDDQEQGRSDDTDGMTSSDSDSAADPSSESDSTGDFRDLNATVKAEIEDIIKQGGIKRLSNGEPIFKGDPSSDNRHRLCVHRMSEYHGSSPDPEAERVERERDANFMKKLRTCSFFEAGGLLIKADWGSENETNAPAPDQCGRISQPQPDPDENVNTLCVYDNRTGIYNNDEVMARADMRAPDDGFTMYPINENVVRVVQVQPQLANPDQDPVIAESMDQMIIKQEPLELLHAGVKTEPQMTISPEAVKIELLDGKSEITAISAVVDVEIPIAEPETNNSAGTGDAEIPFAALKVDPEMSITPKALKIDPEMSVTPEALKIDSETSITPEAIKYTEVKTAPEVTITTTAVTTGAPFTHFEPTMTSSGRENVDDKMSFNSMKVGPERPITPNAVDVTIAFSNVKIEPGLPIAHEYKEVTTTLEKGNAEPDEPHRYQQDDYLESNDVVGDNDDRLVGQCTSFESFKDSTSTDLPEYLPDDHQCEENSYNTETELSPTRQTVNEDDEELIELQRYQREMVRRNVLWDPSGPGPYFVLRMLRKYTIPQRVLNLGQSEMTIFGHPTLAVHFQEALYRELDITNGVNLLYTDDIEKFMAYYDPKTSNVKYLIYLMDCESDDTFDIKRFLRHAKLLKPLIHPSQKVDFLICKRRNSYGPNIRMDGWCKLTQKVGTRFTTFMYDAPRVFEAQIEACKNKYLRLSAAVE